MPPLSPRIVRLNKQHDRASFRCGVPSLDTYLHRQAGQDTRRDVASIYVLEGEDGQEIQGYYTLSAYGIRSESFPPEIQKKLPRYDVMPAYLLGRLAIAERYKGQGLGKLLLINALHNCVRSQDVAAAMAVVGDAIDEQAANFYKHYDFQPFPNQPLKLFLKMSLLTKMF